MIGILNKILFGKKRETFIPPFMSEDELKQKIHILIIDDKKNDLDKNLIKHGWATTSIRDLDSYEQPELKSSQIICIDINGVGAKLGCSDEEGMGLAAQIKKLYPEKKIILYSSEKDHNIFSDSLNNVDRRLNKTGEFYPFYTAVKELAEEIYNWDNCIEYIYGKYQKAFEKKISFNEFKELLVSGTTNQSISANEIIKITGIAIEYASNIAKIITLCLTQGA